MRRVGLFPGTFDPVTLGHLDILGRALHLFDRMIVAVAHRHHKETLFTVDERIAMLRESLNQEQTRVVEVTAFEGLLVDYARLRQVTGIVRGLRFVSDFEYEFQMALMNQRLYHDIDTIFLMPTEQYSYLNATLVKEVGRNGGSLSGFVTPEVERRLARKFSDRRADSTAPEAAGDGANTAAGALQVRVRATRPPERAGAGRGRSRSGQGKDQGKGRRTT